MTEAGVRVFYVTHLYDLAHRLHEASTDSALFLRAPRGRDGRRHFKLVEGEPLSTSFGEDLYRHIFGLDDQPPLTTDAVGQTQTDPVYDRSASSEDRHSYTRGRLSWPRSSTSNDSW